MFSRGIGTNKRISRFRRGWAKGVSYWFALRVLMIVRFRARKGLSPSNSEANTLGQAYAKGENLDCVTYGILSRPE